MANRRFEEIKGLSGNEDDEKVKNFDKRILLIR